MNISQRQVNNECIYIEMGEGKKKKKEGDEEEQISFKRKIIRTKNSKQKAGREKILGVLRNRCMSLAPPSLKKNWV